MKLFQAFKLLALALALSAVVYAQSAATPQEPAQPTQMTPAAPLPPKAPQVVTIVHRINGLKMFRLLLRSERQLEAIANFDETFSLLEDVHTNVIAGLAMDDGETVAAWLPEAELEFGFD